ncbi:MAG: glycosyltransferase family 2 protein [Candidatus Dojkabacteria bacterium]|nr:glycosyltransferase family 2 protein [Candidatus Dojkabacteria bacterium]
MKNPSVSVVILSYNDSKFLPKNLGSLKKQTYDNFSVKVYDNCSDEDVASVVHKEYPDVPVKRFDSNLGFSKGNNEGMAEAFRNGADFCLLLNADTHAEPGMIEEMVSTYRRQKKAGVKVGLIQPVILLYQDPTKINTIGNAIHFLGFGYCRDYNKVYRKMKKDAPIAFVSGAGLLISKEYYRDVGGLDEDFFIYNEDQNLSWKGLMKGYTHFVSSRSVLYHHFDFHRRPFKIYHSEKNRIMMLFENYTSKTLAFMVPIIFLNEMAALIYSPFGGYLSHKLKSYWYVLTHWKEIADKRKRVQAERIVPDRDIIGLFDATFNFSVMNNFAIRHILNPLYAMYYKFLQKVV